jgi:hypothetical protein
MTETAKSKDDDAIRLFKYVRPERIDILENQQIRFTPPKEFNDALDTRPRVIPMTSKAVLKKKAKEHEAEALRHLPPEFHLRSRAERRRIQRELFKGSIKHIQEKADAIARKLQEDIYLGVNQFFGVLCLTENLNHRLMWGHYTNGDRGFVIEFDAENPRFSQANLHQIIYSYEPPTYDPAVGSHGWWKVKSKEWEYEREYRIVSELCDCEKRIVNKQAIYLRRLPRNCIKSVFMGLAMEHGIKKRLKDVCQPSEIKLFEAVISNGKTPYEFREA